MRMLKAMSMKRFRQAVARPVRRFAGEARERWGPFVRFGKVLRVQAMEGYRAAVVEVRPGLYLVAEVSAETLKPEFGVLPMLAPLVVSAARAALNGRSQKPRRPSVPAEGARWVDPQDVDDAMRPQLTDGRGHACRPCR